MKLFLLLGVSSVIGFREDRLDLSHLQPDHFSRVRTLDRPERKNLPVRKRRSEESTSRSRREEEDGFNKCGDFNDSKFKEDNVVSTFKIPKDTNPSISLVWTGENGHILAVTTYESFVAYPSKLYLSTNGGRHFEEITDKISNEYIR